jgi:hypothetical protein
MALDKNEIWPEPLPNDPLMRRVVLWRALAVSAAAGRISLDRILVCLIMDTFRPPTDEALVNLLTEARAALVQQKET